MRRIVVTGLGAVTPLAAGVETSWSRLLAGRSGIRRLIGETEGQEPNGKAMAILSTMVGALILSRTVNDERLSKRFLQAAANSVRTMSSASGRDISKRNPAQRKKRLP